MTMYHSFFKLIQVGIFKWRMKRCAKLFHTFTFIEHKHKRNPILILPFIMLCRLDVFKIGGKHFNENFQSVSSSSSLPCRHEPSQSGPWLWTGGRRLDKKPRWLAAGSWLFPAAVKISLGSQADCWLLAPGCSRFHLSASTRLSLELELPWAGLGWGSQPPVSSLSSAG